MLLSARGRKTSAVFEKVGIKVSVEGSESKFDDDGGREKEMEDEILAPVVPSVKSKGGRGGGGWGGGGGGSFSEDLDFGEAPNPSRGKNHPKLLFL